LAARKAVGQKSVEIAENFFVAAFLPHATS
jgi:hypothetical protein